MNPFKYFIFSQRTVSKHVCICAQIYKKFLFKIRTFMKFIAEAAIKSKSNY